MKRTAVLPRIAKRRLRWFTRYIHFYLRRNFHGIHLLKLAELDQLESWPLLVCLNHPSWWDPLIAACLSQRFFKERNHYAPIAAVGLAKYPFFGRIGFFSVEPVSRFFEIGSAALRNPNCALWVTPQGRFSDVRERPLRILTGVGHLTHRLSRVAMLPVALEYAFWNERRCEAFACVGEPIFIGDGSTRSAKEWSACFEHSLEQTLDTLSQTVRRRDPAAFEPLLEMRWCP